MRVRSTGPLLVPAAALAVHQARYTLAYGSRANAELAAQGHSYLNSVVPWTILAIGVAGTAFLRRVARAVRTGQSGRPTPVSAAALWAITTVGLIGIYSIQETLEGMVSSGHPGGLAGVFGHGGYWALPAAAVAALLVVALLRFGTAIVRLAAELSSTMRPAPLVLATFFPSSARLVLLGPLARAAAGRAPPSARS
ncbi:MAG TPA: hypothetical protein VFA97_05625 [Gaiellaceae bacterium]|nr:hypothetical protein [Gaiellaceae bacterium]